MKFNNVLNVLLLFLNLFKLFLKLCCKFFKYSDGFWFIYIFILIFDI